MNIYDYLRDAAEIATDMVVNDDLRYSIDHAADVMVTALKNGNKLVACGNGGSMCDAMHFASELTGRYKRDRSPIAAIAISDGAHLSCVSNDYEYSAVFSRWIGAHGKEGDVLLAISTSGKSYNVYSAALCAIREKKMRVIVLTGDKDNGGNDFNLIKADPAVIVINAPSLITNHIQECHIKIIHILVELIEKGL